jgi:hypothetical protein
VVVAPTYHVGEIEIALSDLEHSRALTGIADQRRLGDAGPGLFSVLVTLRHGAFSAFAAPD